MAKMTQKKIIELNKEKFDAVYFDDGIRVLIYGNISKMSAIEELLKFQNLRLKKPITMILIPIGKIPDVFVNRKIEDYQQFIGD